MSGSRKISRTPLPYWRLILPHHVLVSSCLPSEEKTDMMGDGEQTTVAEIGFICIEIMIIRIFCINLVVRELNISNWCLLLPKIITAQTVIYITKIRSLGFLSVQKLKITIRSHSQWSNRIFSAKARNGGGMIDGHLTLEVLTIF